VLIGVCWSLRNPQEEVLHGYKKGVRIVFPVSPHTQVLAYLCNGWERQPHTGVGIYFLIAERGMMLPMGCYCPYHLHCSSDGQVWVWKIKRWITPLLTE